MRNKLLLLALILLPINGYAQDASPGSACTIAGSSIVTGASGGTGNLMVCQGGTWKTVIGFSNAAQITKLGNQTCNTNEILKFDGTNWACAATTGDNLGNHTATQLLGMGGFEVNNAAFYTLAAVNGNGLRFWATDAYKIYMAAQGFANAGRLDSTSDYNMYFRMGSGTNRGFVFQNGATNVFQIDGAGNMWSTGPVKIFDAATNGFSGSGASLTSLNAGNISTGTVTAARLGSGTANNSTFLRGDNTWSNAIVGTVTATTFSGSGASLTNLPAANLTGTLPAISGASLTSLNASNISSGTVATARLGSGTANSTSFLRGDGTWAAPSAATTPSAIYEITAAQATHIGYTVPAGTTLTRVTNSCQTAGCDITATCSSGTVRMALSAAWGVTSACWSGSAVDYTMMTLTGNDRPDCIGQTNCAETRGTSWPQCVVIWCGV